ncbi:hypothetical protein CDCA_CDCA09G2673 [Cyanidium caldarium]|uniref:VHS domain-containing protein n=1 Tax=Cyanidium caldarium TaxID=2771 RepID=A0AAV9IX32_CYACA|nr:hypothetical protein CDCA_CDCA09G2673 [Cyanidium caldarium]
MQRPFEELLLSVVEQGADSEERALSGRPRTRQDGSLVCRQVEVAHRCVEEEEHRQWLNRVLSDYLGESNEVVRRAYGITGGATRPPRLFGLGLWRRQEAPSRGHGSSSASGPLQWGAAEHSALARGLSALLLLDVCVRNGNVVLSGSIAASCLPHVVAAAQCPICPGEAQCGRARLPPAAEHACTRYVGRARLLLRAWAELLQPLERELPAFRQAWEDVQRSGLSVPKQQPAVAPPPPFYPPSLNRAWPPPPPPRIPPPPRASREAMLRRLRDDFAVTQATIEQLVQATQLAMQRPGEQRDADRIEAARLCTNVLEMYTRLGGLIPRLTEQDLLAEALRLHEQAGNAVSEYEQVAARQAGGGAATATAEAPADDATRTPLSSTTTEAPAASAPNAPPEELLRLEETEQDEVAPNADAGHANGTPRPDVLAAVFGTDETQAHSPEEVHGAPALLPRPYHHDLVPNTAGHHHGDASTNSPRQ